MIEKGFFCPGEVDSKSWSNVKIMDRRQVFEQFSLVIKEGLCKAALVSCTNKGGNFLGSNINRMEKVWDDFCTLVGGGSIPSEREMTLEFELGHAAGTARIAQFLAAKRELDIEIAFILGVLHDYGRIMTGSKKDHARIGSNYVREYLTQSNCFTEDEIEVLVRAVANHSCKDELGSPFEELIKDADVLDGFLAGRKPKKTESERRLESVFKEFDLKEMV